MLTENVLLNRAQTLDHREREILESAIAHTQTYTAGQVVVRQGMPVGHSTLLVKGLVTRHVDAADGRRHLVALHIPGDFVDLHAYALKKLDHDVAALTDITVAVSIRRRMPIPPAMVVCAMVCIRSIQPR